MTVNASPWYTVLVVVREVETVALAWWDTLPRRKLRTGPPAIREERGNMTQIRLTELSAVAEEIRPEAMRLIEEQGHLTDEQLGALARLHSGYKVLCERYLDIIDDYLTGERVS